MNIFQRKFCPSFISEWNKTDINIQNAESFIYIKSSEINLPQFLSTYNIHKKLNRWTIFSTVPSTHYLGRDRFEKNQ